jgi:hypothetical protein
MRHMDLQGSDGSLVSSAAAKVLAVMSHPEDSSARRRMLSGLDSQPGSRLDEGSDGAFVQNVCHHAQSGALAGQVLHTLIQLHRGDYRVSINNVIKIMRASPEAWHRPPPAPEWHSWIKDPKLRIHRQAVFKTFRSFRSVAHFWAALVFAMKRGSSCPFPDCNENLPRFLGVSNAFYDATRKITRVGGKREPILPANLIWRFGLPPNLKVKVSLDIAPLSFEASTVLK